MAFETPWAQRESRVFVAMIGLGACSWRYRTSGSSVPSSEQSEGLGSPVASSVLASVVSWYRTCPEEALEPLLLSWSGHSLYCTGFGVPFGVIECLSSCFWKYTACILSQCRSSTVSSLFILFLFILFTMSLMIFINRIAYWLYCDCGSDDLRLNLKAKAYVLNESQLYGLRHCPFFSTSKLNSTP